MQQTLREFIMNNKMEKNIIILGGSIAGITTAHYLLRNTIPQLENCTAATKSMEETESSASNDLPSINYRITLINPSSKFLFRIALPRSVVRPDMIPMESLMQDIEQAFQDYPRDKFTFIQGWANEINPITKEVTIKLAGTSQDNPFFKTIIYDALVIATGSSTPTNTIWSPNTTEDQILQYFNQMHESVKYAQSILVSGGGPLGVEICGELAANFKPSPTSSSSNPSPPQGKPDLPNSEKTIYLVSKQNRLLSSIRRHDVGDRAERYLRNMGVHLKLGVSVESVENINSSTLNPSQQHVSAKNMVHFSDKTSLPIDLVIDATGLKPNSSFLPPTWVNDRGYIMVDDHMRLLTRNIRDKSSSITSSMYEDKDQSSIYDVPRRRCVYAIGSVCSYIQGTVLDVKNCLPALSDSIAYDLSNGALDSLKPSKWVRQYMLEHPEAYIDFSNSLELPALGSLSRRSDTMIVVVGPSYTVGVAWDWWLPSILGWWFKGRSYNIEAVEGFVSGTRLF